MPRAPRIASARRPTSLQLQLLRVAFREPDDARASWERLRPELVLDDVWDAETYGLLPLVAQRLAALEIEDPVIPRLKGLHRREWYRNQLQLSRLSAVLRDLNRADIDTIVLGGVALALRYYGDVGSRPMERVDVLVPTGRAADALRLLAGNGADHPSYRMPGLVSEQSRRLGWSSDTTVQLHWHLGAPFVLPRRGLQSDDEFWEAAEHVDVAGVATRVLNPSDQLLHTVVGGLPDRGGPCTRWIADACVILAHGGAIDWDRFVDNAESRRLAPLAGLALEFLAEQVEAPVPVETRQRLARAPRSRYDLRALARSGSTDGPSGSRRGVFDLGSMWAWRRAKLGYAAAAVDLPRFLQDEWRVPAALVPIEALRRIRRRVRERVDARRAARRRAKIGGS